MNQRDIELLSSHLDGHLTSSESAKLEARLKTDPELESALRDLRAARTLLRKLPHRRAPRNFTLTRKMVGLNPPLPRAYPIFRFATVLATLLFFATAGVNFLAPQLASAPGIGMGGGGPETESFAQSAPAAEEAQVATEAPAISAAAAPPEETVVTEDSIRIAETPVSKGADVGNAESEMQAPAEREEPVIPFVWLYTFAILILAGAGFMMWMRRRSFDRWK